MSTFCADKKAPGEGRGAGGLCAVVPEAQTLSLAHFNLGSRMPWSPRREGGSGRLVRVSV